jgi:hypothetical protein
MMKLVIMEFSQSSCCRFLGTLFAESVQWLTTGCTTEVRLEKGQEFIFITTSRPAGCEVHPVEVCAGRNFSILPGPSPKFVLKYFLYPT